MLDIIYVILRTTVGIAAIIALTRIMGLRSFSKMSGYDFAITVAMGSVLAAAATTPSSSIWIPIFAILSLFGVQKILTVTRSRERSFADAIDNDPLLIMEDGEPLMDNLNGAGMTLGDLYGKLREANAYDLSTVKAVIFEPTGDVSVLHGNDDLSPEVMEGVRRSLH